jgi:hypothetical protein
MYDYEPISSFRLVSCYSVIITAFSVMEANILRLSKATINVCYIDFNYPRALWWKMRHSDHFSIVCSTMTTAPSYDLHLDLPSCEIAGEGLPVFYNVIL